MAKCQVVLELDQHRQVKGGSSVDLHRAISAGADLRVYTEFRFNEHVDAASPNTEIVCETSDFPVTYLIDARWVAGIMTLRQPVTLPDRFGERASMSFFLYNEDGQQAVARPYLDGRGYVAVPAVSANIDTGKFHHLGDADQDTAAPSLNFIYDFGVYRFIVRDDWQQVYVNDKDGHPLSGSLQHLAEASADGCEIKVGIDGLCDGRWSGSSSLSHELFIQTGPHYYHTANQYLVAETRPLVRVQPQIPTVYASKNWDFGWCIVRSDGHIAGLYYDPYTLKDHRTFTKHRIRWFVR